MAQKIVFARSPSRDGKRRRFLFAKMIRGKRSCALIKTADRGWRFLIKIPFSTVGRSFRGASQVASNSTKQINARACFDLRLGCLMRSLILPFSEIIGIHFAFADKRNNEMMSMARRKQLQTLLFAGFLFLPSD